jgi:dihydrofolate reductase
MTKDNPDKAHSSIGKGDEKMRKVVASEYMTLDGFFAGPNGEIDWFVWDKETEKYSKELIASIDTLLFGRVTYQLMAAYWPTASPPADDPAIIQAMNSLPKFVFSKTLEKADWKNSRLVPVNDNDELAKEIEKLKQQPGKDIVIYGSGLLVSTLANLGLIDEYHLFVNPVILGQGKPLFQNINVRQTMKLMSVKTFDVGVVGLHYSKG